MKKIFMQNILVVLKLSAFCFEINSFSWLLYQIHIAFTEASMWHPKHGSILLYRCESTIFRRQAFKL